MAYARKTKKVMRRRRRAYRKKRYAKRSVLSFSKAPMPNRFATKLRYAESFSINPPTGGVAGTYVFVANGLYDPNVTGTGHQPRGFDQFMTMYDHYTVIGSKITATFTSAGIVGTSGPLTVGIALKDGTLTASNKNDYMEGRNVKSGVLLRAAGSDEAHKITLSKSFSTKKFLGVSHPLSSNVLRGSVSSNPIEDAYFHLFAQIMTGAVDSAPIEVQVVIDYLTVFTEPKQPAQS